MGKAQGFINQEILHQLQTIAKRLDNLETKVKKTLDHTKLKGRNKVKKSQRGGVDVFIKNMDKQPQENQDPSKKECLMTSCWLYNGWVAFAAP